MTALTGEPIVGMNASWVWQDPAARGVGQIPAGVLVDHGDHTMLVPWSTHAAADVALEGVFTLDALRPLTVVEAVVCTVCGAEGRIEQGAWLPAEGGDGR